TRSKRDWSSDVCSSDLSKTSLVSCPSRPSSPSTDSPCRWAWPTNCATSSLSTTGDCSPAVVDTGCSLTSVATGTSAGSTCLLIVYLLDRSYTVESTVPQMAT